MTKENIHKKLSSIYSRENWKALVDAMFPNRDFFATDEQIDFTKNAQVLHTESILRFGNIELDDGAILALYEVKLKSDNQTIRIAKNRVGLRSLLTSEVIPGIVDGALICYYQEGIPEWRFSFFSQSAFWDEEGKEVKKETHPKRYTYVLGPPETGETCITPRDRFYFLIEKRKRTIKDVLEAFSVEKVSKEFFTKYKKHYQDFVDEIINSNAFTWAFNKDDKAVRDFVKKMLGRIVFLHYIQKKGWLDIPEGKNYGEGSKTFLQDLFRKHNNEAFYSKCLVPLFFNTLNNPDNGHYEVTGNKFPYLNGGLFEKDELEKKGKVCNLTFTTKLFENLFIFFSQYNFTIDENTHNDLDVGIDPEMLGHIFENLLEENHEKGAYYTPKMIVQYMCQETLIQYLKLHLGDYKELESFIRYQNVGDRQDKKNFIHKNAPRIEELLNDVKICDPAIGSGAFPMGLLQEIYHAILTLDWTIEDKAGLKRNIIKNSIYGVDIDRGAVDIARLRFWLSIIVDEEVKPGKNPEALPNFDYKIMQGNSLFESFKGIPLVYKSGAEIEQNSERNLFGEVKEPQLSVNYGSNTDLVKLERDFYDPANNHRKEEIRLQINELVAKTIKKSIESEIQHKKKLLIEHSQKSSSEAYQKKIKYKNELKKELKELTEAAQEIKQYLRKEEKPYFLWHLYFKEVFDKGGFDIVIGNPPYIRQEEIAKQGIKPFLQKVGGKTNYEVYNSVSDIYTYFFELGHKIMKSDKSVFSFICSKKYTRARYGQKLRKYLMEKAKISGYVDFNEVQVFGATVDTSIILFQRSQELEESYSFPYCQVGNDIQRNIPLIDYLLQNGSSYAFKYLNEDNWAFLDPKEEKIKDIFYKNGRILKDWDVEFNRGITSGLNEAFYINEETKEYLISNGRNYEKWIKPILRGRDIGRYLCEFDKIWVLYIPWHFPLHEDKDIVGASTKAEKEFNDRYSHIYNHLLRFKHKLQKRNKAETGVRYEWYALQRFANTFSANFYKEKIVWLVLSDKASFAYEPNGFFINDSAFMMVGENLKYLLAILNSKPCEWLFTKITTSSGVGTSMWKKAYVEQIPIPEIPKIKMKPFEILADYISYIKKQDKAISPYSPNKHMAVNFEELVDACVYELYFEEHMKEKQIDVLQFVTPLLKSIEHLDEDKQKAEINNIINEVYDTYKATNSLIRQRMLQFPTKSPDIINVIQNG
jgi:adenine-specific DNA-methyltransferase